MNKNREIAILVLTSYMLFCGIVSAKIITDANDNRLKWNETPEAYRPNPILFSHGFASDPKQAWWDRHMDDNLLQYFEDYYCMVDIEGKPLLALPTPVLYNQEDYPQTRYPYLEMISYIDFTKADPAKKDFTSQELCSQLVDKNSSIDTYQLGDSYVESGDRKATDPALIPSEPLSFGWADKLYEAVPKLRNVYKDKNGNSQKIVLICHSMGGLTAREYMTNPKYRFNDYFKSAVLIGVPNKGAPLGNVMQGVVACRNAGWFIPGIGWLFSSVVTGLDKWVLEKKGSDMDGDALRDMSENSAFISTLNSRPQPSKVDFFVIWGSGQGLMDVLVARHLYHGDGDGMVSEDSQLGKGVLILKESLPIIAGHAQEIQEVSQNHLKTLLEFFDYTTPEVTITGPDPIASPTPEVKTFDIRVTGMVAKEYLPADCTLKIEAARIEDGTSVPPVEGKSLYPSDLWNPSDPNSVVAEFDEPIKVTNNGTYNIFVTVTNPGGQSSMIKTTQVKVNVASPVISLQSPPYGFLTDRRPLIQARIYSPDNIDIDLSSIELKVDDTAVSPNISPAAGGWDITITYTPVNDLSVNNPDTASVNEGRHTIRINAKDKLGLIALEYYSDIRLRIFAFCPQRIVELMRAVNEREKAIGLSQTVFKNAATSVSLGTPDGGVNVPSLNALSNTAFVSSCIVDLQTAVKRLANYDDTYTNAGAFWDTAGDVKWTFPALYKSAMCTSGAGAGLDNWKHSSSQISNYGVETIDIDEISRCLSKMDTIRLPVRSTSQIASYLFYAIVDYGRWNGNSYTPDGSGDSLYYPISVFLGDEGQSWDKNNVSINNSTERAFFGGNISNFSAITLNHAVAYITVSVSEGNPASLGSCQLGHFVPIVTCADFQKSVETVISDVPISSGTFSFVVTSCMQTDINNNRKESWYKGWFTQLTDNGNDWDRIKWTALRFMVKPTFRNN